MTFSLNKNCTAAICKAQVMHLKLFGSQNRHLPRSPTFISLFYSTLTLRQANDISK